MTEEDYADPAGRRLDIETGKVQTRIERRRQKSSAVDGAEEEDWMGGPGRTSRSSSLRRALFFPSRATSEGEPRQPSQQDARSYLSLPRLATFAPISFRPGRSIRLAAISTSCQQRGQVTAAGSWPRGEGAALIHLDALLANAP